ncbi:hypothetical protein [Mesorhizobium sp.]|uniref:hypothetical protein n=1 Tax=Mesorhizobium sp. TaxID=1871066 RepID=UPI000FE52EFB|nr:hypothetical protein [Mesorhizobium sp.]RWK47202.1 MAG: hypothetical protein EOR48_32580 [Mesorhizobium sp.]RWK74859.1 MAG: hypothetical protein EOR45_33405 [Mesorhizobium sp.]TIP39636.1 MAG: hypothetical protein E5X62_30645 [Mesorhizobium sp.]
MGWIAEPICWPAGSQLRRLFGFFSALCIPTSFYASDHEFAVGFPADPVAKERIEPAGAQLAALLLQRRRVPSPEFNIRAATAA